MISDIMARRTGKGILDRIIDPIAGGENAKQTITFLLCKILQHYNIITLKSGPMNILDLFNVNFLFIDKDAHLLDSIRYKRIMQNSDN